MFSNFSAFTDLIKYKLSLAIVLSSVTGYYLYKNTIDHHFFFLISGIFFLASGSAALNQYTERKTDSIMERTKYRPIPSKKISERTAAFIILLLLLTGCIFLYNNGITPLLLGIFNVILYNVFYTLLKKTTVLSIIPGALVGAVPPIIGFSSAGGAIVQHNIIGFSTFMFLWQLPHFWLIILKYGKEYKAAGFATITNYLTEIQIRYLVFFWVLSTTCFLSFFFFFIKIPGRNVFPFLCILNLIFIFFFYRLLFLKNEPRKIKGAFILINSFSFSIMFLLIVLSLFNVI